MYKHIAINHTTKRSLDDYYAVNEFNIHDVSFFESKGVQHFLTHCTQTSKATWVTWLFDPNYISTETQRPVYFKTEITYSKKYDSDILKTLDSYVKSTFNISHTQGHFYFKVSECITADDNPDTNTSLFEFRLSDSRDNNSTVCELQHLTKGTLISGTQGLQYLEFFKKAFNITQTILADASTHTTCRTLTLTHANLKASIPVKTTYSLKKYKALLTGASWYESKQYGPIVCKHIKDHKNSSLAQHPLAYKLAIKKIQATSIQFLWTHHASAQQTILTTIMEATQLRNMSYSLCTINDVLHELDKTKNTMRTQQYIASLLDLLAIKHIKPHTPKQEKEAIQLHNLALDSIQNTMVFLSPQPHSTDPNPHQTFDALVYACSNTIPSTYSKFMTQLFKTLP